MDRIGVSTCSQPLCYQSALETAGGYALDLVLCSLAVNFRAFTTAGEKVLSRNHNVIAS